MAMKRWGPKLWLLLPVLLVVGSGVVAVSILKSSNGSDKVEAISCTGAKSSDFSCWQQHYDAIVADQGPEAAIADAKVQADTNSFIKSDCHQITHVIGRAAAKKYQTLAETYTHGDDYCASGYYHGALETIAAKIGPDHIKAEVPNICQSFAKSEPYKLPHYNCVHGLGHGIMAIENDDLFKSLTVCGSLNNDWEQQSCYGGVFMENVMNDINKGVHKATFKAEDPMYPCTAVANQYKSACYMNQTSHALQTISYDYGKMFELCSSPAEWAAICDQSLGRDVSGLSVNNQDLTVQRCMLGADFNAKDNCFTGAVKDFVWHYHGEKEGLAMCAAVPDSKLAANCKNQADSYFATF
jgi:hypothetical protein